MKTKSLFENLQEMEVKTFEAFDPIVEGSKFKMPTSEAKKVTVVVRDVPKFEGKGTERKICATLPVSKGIVKNAWVRIDFTVVKSVKPGMFLDPSKLIFFKRDGRHCQYQRVAFHKDAILDQTPAKANFKKDWED